MQWRTPNRMGETLTNSIIWWLMAAWFLILRFIASLLLFTCSLCNNNDSKIGSESGEMCCLFTSVDRLYSITSKALELTEAANLVNIYFGASLVHFSSTVTVTRSFLYCSLLCTLAPRCWLEIGEVGGCLMLWTIDKEKSIDLTLSTQSCLTRTG